MGNFFLKKDNLKLGLILGFLTPFAGIAVFYYWKFSAVTFQEFFSYLKTNKNLVTSMSMICLFLNVVIFTFYVNTKRDQTAKGIFVMTVLFAICSLLFKFWG